VQFRHAASNGLVGGQVVNSANTSAMPHVFIGIPISIAVDANRDGNLTFGPEDGTRSDHPFVFWLNNDVDRWTTMDSSLFSDGYPLQDDLDPTLGSGIDANDTIDYRGKLDWQLDNIPGTRDLEDFSTLAINAEWLAQIQYYTNSTVYLGLKWKAVDTPAQYGPQPTIKLYWAYNMNLPLPSSYVPMVAATSPSRAGQPLFALAPLERVGVPDSPRLRPAVFKGTSGTGLFHVAPYLMPSVSPPPDDGPTTTGVLNDYLINSTVAENEVGYADGFQNVDGSYGAIKDISGVAAGITLPNPPDGANGTLVAANISTDPSAPGGVTGTDYDFVLPQSVFASVTPQHPFVYLHFEGCQRGRGELELVLLKDNGDGTVSKLADGPGLWLELKDIKELYERYTVGQGNPTVGNETVNTMMLPANTAPLSTEGLASGASPFSYDKTHPGLSIAGDANGNKYILFIHGSNLPPWDRDAFAETMLKRLYWQGYKGKFGAYQWPTPYNPTSITQYPLSFDDGDYTALLSAAPLLSLWKNQLGAYSSASPSNLYIMAHSHGNLVVGEALRQAGQQNSTVTLVNTYVACQAAVPAEAYAPSAVTSAALPFNVSNITVPGYFNTSLVNVSGNFGPDTPDIYAGWIAPTGNVTAAAAMVNFYNTNDWALHLWNANQMIKPVEAPQNTTVTVLLLPVSVSLWGKVDFLGGHIAGIRTSSNSSVYSEAPYGYAGNTSANATSTGFFKTPYWTSNSTLTGGSNTTLFLDTSNPQGNVTALPTRYEIIAFAAEARSLGLGETPGTIGNFAPQNEQSLWPSTDPLGATGSNAYNEHPWHSGEFRFDAASQNIYWNTLLGPAGFNLLP